MHNDEKSEVYQYKTLNPSCYFSFFLIEFMVTGGRFLSYWNFQPIKLGEDRRFKQNKKLSKNESDKCI